MFYKFSSDSSFTINIFFNSTQKRKSNKKEQNKSEKLKNDKKKISKQNKMCTRYCFTTLFCSDQATTCLTRTEYAAAHYNHTSRTFENPTLSHTLTILFRLDICLSLLFRPWRCDAVLLHTCDVHEEDISGHLYLNGFIYVRSLLSWLLLMKIIFSFLLYHSMTMIRTTQPSSKSVWGIQDRSKVWKSRKYDELSAMFCEYISVMSCHAGEVIVGS